MFDFLQSSLSRFSGLGSRDKFTRLGLSTLISPASHQLPNRLQRHKYYDRFIPIVAKKLGDSPLIIDIGSNIGDTITLISSLNANCKFVCIEPDPFFYGYLTKNIKYNRIEAECFNKPIASSPTFVKIDRNSYNSTGSRSCSSGDDVNTPNSISYSDLNSSSLFMREKRADIIKVDIDGFDHDALESIYNFYASSNPNKSDCPGLIYFELMLPPGVDKLSLEAFKRSNISTIKKLRELQLTRATIFSNYGLPILTLPLDCLNISDLCDYMFSSLNSRSDLVYFDILLSSPSVNTIVSESLQDLLLLP